VPVDGQPEGARSRDGGAGGAPDGEIVRRILRGEADAFAELVHRYREAFGRYATAVCGDGDLAADAMQEAFIRAFHSLADCRNPDRFGAWFFRILTNQCRNHRSRWRRHEAEDAATALETKESADEALLRGELRDVIEQALGGLSAEQREAFVLRHMDGRSYQEMAELLGEREDTLRMRVHRAREQMQRFLEERT
jgi:RNA polymerase sigma-70 factor (ECF subfamily)